MVVELSESKQCCSSATLSYPGRYKSLDKLASDPLYLYSTFPMVGVWISHFEGYRHPASYDHFSFSFGNKQCQAAMSVWLKFTGELI